MGEIKWKPVHVEGRPVAWPDDCGGMSGAMGQAEANSEGSAGRKAATLTDMDGLHTLQLILDLMDIDVAEWLMNDGTTRQRKAMVKMKNQTAMEVEEGGMVLARAKTEHKRIKGNGVKTLHKTPPEHVRRGGTNQTRADDKNSQGRDRTTWLAVTEETGRALR